MRINDRPYRDKEDLLQIGRLIRHAHAQAPHCNAWSFARFDIWAQRRIGDEQVHGIRDWQQAVRLWEVERGDFAGAVWFPYDHSAALAYDPERSQVVESMLAWAEIRYTENGATDKRLGVEAMASNAFLEQLLQSRGYIKPEEHFLIREKALDGGQVEPVPLPTGFHVQPIETVEELGAFLRAVEVVFNFPDPVEVYRIVQQAPSYVPELDLILLSVDREVAAFCTAWLDRESGIAEFEPVGTMPEYRRRGLGAALLADASNRLRSAGCRKATVFSWSESPGANKLYAAAGMLGMERMYKWQWQRA